MSNTELENAKVSDVQPGPKDLHTELRSLGAAAKSRQAKRSGARRLVKSVDASRFKKLRPAKDRTKQDIVIQMLGRQSGVSVDDIAAKTGWQKHSVRGFLSAVV